MKINLNLTPVTITDRETGELLTVTAKIAEAMDFTQCDVCGEWHPNEDMHEAFRGSVAYNVCVDCINNGDWFTCDDCGEIHHIYDRNVVNEYNWRDEHYVCDNCADDYHRCSCCGGLVTDRSISMTDDNGTIICDSCGGEYTRCGDCGRIISYDEAYSGEDDDEYYCYRCFHNGNRSYRHGYSYKPEPNFHETGNETEDTFAYLGVELEVDKGSDWSDLCGHVHNEFDDSEDKLYMKYDGSLDRNGVELVSHPCTLDYHMNNFKWDKLFAICRSHNYLSHDANTCGLHIHVGREELLHDTPLRLVVLVDAVWDELFKFSRRRDQEWCQRPELAERIEREKQFAESCEKTFTLDDEMLMKLANYSSGSHYSAVNTCPCNTVEVRVFRGTLNRTTFFASLQLVSNLVEYANTHTAMDCWNAKWSDVVNIKSYPELTEYLAKRGL